MKLLLIQDKSIVAAKPIFRSAFLNSDLIRVLVRAEQQLSGNYIRGTGRAGMSVS